MNVLIIPEDFRKDQYMLKPIISAMMKALGKPKARVRVCQDPLLGGISEALKWDNIQAILDRYRMVDLFLLCVDRDGKPGRQKSLRKLEQESQNILTKSQVLLAENAWQEIEVWVLAGHSLPKDWNWQDIRQEVDPKEAYFLPFAQQQGLLDTPGEGRKQLAESANYQRICQLCSEDVANLEDRIKTWLAQVSR